MNMEQAPGHIRKVWECWHAAGCALLPYRDHANLGRGEKQPVPSLDSNQVTSRMWRHV